MAAGDAVVEEIDVIIFELDDFAAIDADEMVVGRFVDEVGVESFLVAAEVNFAEQSGIDEEFDGAVDGGSGGGKVLALGALEEFFGGKVFVLGESELDDRFALLGVAHTFLPYVCIELVDNFIFHAR